MTMNMNVDKAKEHDTDRQIDESFVESTDSLMDADEWREVMRNVLEHSDVEYLRFNCGEGLWWVETITDPGPDRYKHTDTQAHILATIGQQVINALVEMGVTSAELNSR